MIDRNDPQYAELFSGPIDPNDVHITRIVEGLPQGDDALSVEAREYWLGLYDIALDRGRNEPGGKYCHIGYVPVELGFGVIFHDDDGGHDATPKGMQAMACMHLVQLGLVRLEYLPGDDTFGYAINRHVQGYYIDEQGWIDEQVAKAESRARGEVGA